MTNEPEMHLDEIQGIRYWTLNGILHREGEPAVEYLNSDQKEWWLNGFLHRIGGPALQFSNGKKHWWIQGKEFSFEDYISKLVEMGYEDGIAQILWNLNEL